MLHALSCAPNLERLATWRGPIAMPDAYLACTPHAADAVTARLLVWAPPHMRRLLATAPRLASFSGAVAASIHALPALLSSLPADTKHTEITPALRPLLRFVLGRFFLIVGCVASSSFVTGG